MKLYHDSPNLRFVRITYPIVPIERDRFAKYVLGKSGLELNL